MNPDELMAAARRAKAYLLKRTRLQSQVDVDDVIGSTILAAWEFRDRYRDNGCKLSTWVIAISWNQYLLSIRRFKNKEFVASDVLDMMRDPRPNPEQRAIRRERSRKLVDAILDLSSSQRKTVLELVYEGGLGSNNTKKTRFFQAKHQIKRSLDNLERLPIRKRTLGDLK